MDKRKEKTMFHPGKGLMINQISMLKVLQKGYLKKKNGVWVEIVNLKERKYFLPG